MNFTAAFSLLCLALRRTTPLLFLLLGFCICICTNGKQTLHLSLSLSLSLYLDLFSISVSICVWCFYISLSVCWKWGNRVRELGVSVRGETRPTHCVWGVAAAVSISRRVAALPVPTLLPARGLVCLLLSLYHSLVLIYGNIYMFV